MSLSFYKVCASGQRNEKDGLQDIRIDFQCSLLTKFSPNY